MSENKSRKIIKSRNKQKNQVVINNSLKRMVKLIEKLKNKALRKKREMLIRSPTESNSSTLSSTSSVDGDHSSSRKQSSQKKHVSRKHSSNTENNSIRTDEEVLRNPIAGTSHKSDNDYSSNASQDLNKVKVPSRKQYHKKSKRKSGEISQKTVSFTNTDKSDTKILNDNEPHHSEQSTVVKDNKETLQKSIATHNLGPDKAKQNIREGVPSTQSVTLDIHYIENLFSYSLTKNDDVSLYYYILGYEELYIFCQVLGPLFKIVGTEIRGKLDHLKYLLDQDEVNYSTMKTMVNYEIENNLLKKPDFINGCRTFTRLDRGLEFLVEFLKQVYNLNPDDPTNTVGCEVYRNTLGRYHPWLVRKSAAMLLNVGLPTKQVLVTKACGENFEAVNEQLPSMLKVTEEVHKRCYLYFKQHNLLTLP